MAIAITVRSILNMILENNLKMNDRIAFRLSDETFQQNEMTHEIDFVSTEIYKIQGSKEKTLAMIFDLNDSSEDDE